MLKYLRNEVIKINRRNVEKFPQLLQRRNGIEKYEL
jgi:hypothetical protein